MRNIKLLHKYWFDTNPAVGSSKLLLEAGIFTTKQTPQNSWANVMCYIWVETRSNFAIILQ